MTNVIALFLAVWSLRRRDGVQPTVSGKRFSPISRLLRSSKFRPEDRLISSPTLIRTTTNLRKPTARMSAPTANCTLPAPFPTGNLGRNRGITHSFASVDLRLTRAFHFGERFKIELIGEVFNLFNRFNEGSATPFFNDVNAFGQRDSKGRYFSRPTASFDPRQFQLGAKFTF